MTEAGFWRKCNLCKKPIGYGATYWICSVSTCNQKRTRLNFCSVSCWDAHLPEARHRTAWAEEETAPRAHATSPATLRAGDASSGALAIRTAPESVSSPTDILIIASRLKAYVRSRSGMNTSERALGPLSDLVRRICDEAIDHARRAGRETVLDRDVPEDAERKPSWLSR